MCDNLPESRNISTLYSYDTEYSSDSVEWCPHDPHKNIFVCANYQLKENESSSLNTNRFGRILLFSICPNNGLSLLQTIHTPAVLDQKWCHNQLEGYSILGVVNAENTLEVYRLNHGGSQLELLNSSQLREESESETLLLSLDWSTGKFSANAPEIVVSDSKGCVHVWQLINSKLELKTSWKGHEYEAWIAGFYYWDPNIVFSGGDDSVFLEYDLRTGTEPVAKNKTHEAGVTSVHSNKSREFIIATGSYDETVRLWDMRKLKNPFESIRMPGPLWRLKWDPFCQKFLLAACMLGGVHVISGGGKEVEIVGSYYEHKNIAYGADWCFLDQKNVGKYAQEGNVIIGSCSFYDHLLTPCVTSSHNNEVMLTKQPSPEKMSKPDATTALTPELATEILNKILEELQTSENIQKLDVAKENVGNEMLKMMQFLFPIVMQVEMDVIKEFGFADGREGIIKFAMLLRNVEREDAEVARLHSLIKAYYLPSVPVNAMSESPADEKAINS